MSRNVPHPIPDLLAELIAQRLRLLGDPTRIRLLDYLRDCEATVQELTEALGSSQQNISKHLNLLAQAGILSRRKAGKHVYYSIEDRSVFTLCEQICGSLQKSVDELSEVLAGAAR